MRKDNHVIAASSMKMIYAKFLTPKIFGCMDIHCEIQAVPFNELSKMKPGETSTSHRERVIKARLIQEERFKDYKNVHCNAQMTERMLHQYAEPDEASLDMLRLAMEKLSLSARACSRILKVAKPLQIWRVLRKYKACILPKL